MNNQEIINKLKASSFVDEDGESYELDFQEGLSQSKIENLKAIFPNQTIDNELVEILKITKGWDGFGPEMIYFDSIGEFGFTELSPYSLTLGHDGFGNFWILDIDKNGELGKVFFACHDPAVLVVHSQNLTEYLSHLHEFYNKPDSCHLNEIHDKTVFNIWRSNENCLPKAEFLSKNPKYNEFLDKFEGEDWTVADLRDAKNKNGFAWGKYGPNRLTERHPEELIWVIKTKKKGFISRLLGK